MDFSYAVVAGASVITLLVGYLVLHVNRRDQQDDSTPKLLKLPIIGDLHKSPLDRPLLNWDDWAKARGPVASSKLFGIVPILAINTNAAAAELLCTLGRSVYYSNRPSSVSMEMVTDSGPGKSKFTLMHDYDADLKLQHRLLSPSLNGVAAPKFQPLMALESKKLLLDALTAIDRSGDGSTGAVIPSTEIYALLERAQASVILALHYGFRVADQDDAGLHELIKLQKQVTHIAANPSLVDFVPPLRHLPSFMSPWRRRADKLYKAQADLYLRYLNEARQRKGWNATKQAFETASKHENLTAFSELDLAFSLGTSVQGGMETSPRQMMWLFVAALTNPEILRNAHKLLDEVVGRDRLPTFADRPRLPYMDAVVSELTRWRPIAPEGVPRRVDRQDEYHGVQISKGVTIFTNSWALGRDPGVFSPEDGDLQRFIPDRWLDENGDLRSDLPLPVFGHGRRSCLGKRIALDASFMVAASLLWAFDIQPEEDVDPWRMKVAGFTTEPGPFKLRLKQRGPWVRGVIEKEWAAAEKDVEAINWTWENVNEVEGSSSE